MKIIGYLLTFLLLCYVFLLWQFPSRHLKGFLTDTLPPSFPAKLMVGEIKPRVPFTLLIEKNHIQSDFVTIQIPDLRLDLNLLSLLFGKKDFCIENSGSIPTLQAKYRQERNLAKIEVWLKKLGVKALFPNGSSVTAEVSGEGIFQWNGKDYSNGNGQGWLLIHRGELNQKQLSSLPFPLALFEKMEAEFQLKQDVLFVKRLEMTGANQQKFSQRNLQIPLKGGGQSLNLSTFFQIPMK
jgi:type II secretion system protein N